MFFAGYLRLPTTCVFCSIANVGDLPIGRSSILAAGRNAGIFNAKIAGSFHPPILSGAKRREWNGREWRNGGMGEWDDYW